MSRGRTVKTLVADAEDRRFLETEGKNDEMYRQHLKGHKVKWHEEKKNSLKEKLVKSSFNSFKQLYFYFFYFFSQINRVNLKKYPEMDLW